MSRGEFAELLAMARAGRLSAQMSLDCHGAHIDNLDANAAVIRAAEQWAGMEEPLRRGWTDFLRRIARAVDQGNARQFEERRRECENEAAVSGNR